MIYGYILGKIPHLLKGYVEQNIFQQVSDENKRPLLVVGKENAKMCCPEINLLQNEYDNNLFWTFSEEENLHLHNKYSEFFLRKIASLVIQKIKYRNIDLLISKENIFALAEVFKPEVGYYNSLTKKVYYGNRDVTFGIDCRMANYDKENYDKLLTNFNSYIKYKFKDEDYFYIDLVKSIFSHTNYRSFIPSLISQIEYGRKTD